MKGLLALFLLCWSPSVWGQNEKQRYINIVISGGYGSCAFLGWPGELRLFGRIKPILQRTSGDFRITRTCFALSRNTLFVQKLEFRKGRQVWRSQTIRTTVERFVDSYSKGTLLIGQSIGGDLLMQKVLRQSQGSRDRVLVTIDPISLRDCSAMKLVWQGIRPKSTQSGCQKFPYDRVRSLNISEKSKKWVNFYQNKFKWLHSGPAEGAENHFLDYPDFKPAMMGSHGRTEKDERVWLKVEQLLQERG